MEKRDLLLHYDEASQRIIFYTVSSEEVLHIRDKEFDGAFTTVKELQELEPLAAEAKFGGIALSMIDHFSSVKTGIRDYASISKEAHSKYVVQIEASVLAGNHEDEYSLFLEYHSRSMQEYLVEYLEKAEKLLISSAEGGYEEAKEMLNHSWPSMKAAALKRIERSKTF